VHNPRNGPEIQRWEGDAGPERNSAAAARATWPKLPITSHQKDERREAGEDQEERRDHFMIASAKAPENETTPKRIEREDILKKKGES
jgi:hypothetical protein